MKFVPLYLLTFIIARDYCIEGNLSEKDLRFIADRLYPAECSQLLSYLPDLRKASRSRVAKHRGYRNERENSRMQCLESLYECNQREKRVGCTRNWLIASLHKLGRSDLASRLKKRKDTRMKPRKNRATSRKRQRAGRNDKKHGRDRKNYSRKKAVTSGVRGATKKNGTVDKIAEDEFFGRRFLIFVAAGSILVLVFLGCIVVVSYRRACRCYKEFVRNDNVEDDKRYSLGKSFAVQSIESGLPKKSREIDAHHEEFAKLIAESGEGSANDSPWSQDIGSSPYVGKSKNVSFDSGADESEDEGCRCRPNDKKSGRAMSPCARIKRFFDSQKRRLRDIEEIAVEKRRKKISVSEKIRKNFREQSVSRKIADGDDSATRKNNKKHRRKKSRKYTSERGKRAKREKGTNKNRSGRNDLEASRPIGCTCEMCKLFNVTGEGGCSARIAERQLSPRRRES